METSVQLERRIADQVTDTNPTGLLVMSDDEFASAFSLGGTGLPVAGGGGGRSDDDLSLCALL